MAEQDLSREWGLEPAELPRRRPGRANWIVAGLIAGFGALMFLVAVRAGRADSALLFVGLPVALAIALAVVPARTGHGRVFVCTTIGLLLAAVAMQEGAICVILAAPLVYVIGHAATWVIHSVRRRLALVVLPLLLVTGLEGSAESLRVQPVQAVEVTRVVALPADQVAARIATGPRPTAVRSVPLRALGVPVPQHITGGGLAAGDQWQFGYHGTAHGPGGQIVTQVAAAEPGAVRFDIVSDTAITARWFGWEAAEIRWRAIDDGHTEIRLGASFARGLDPSWYFGPLQEVLLRQGLAHLLDMLDLTEPAR